MKLVEVTKDDKAQYNKFVVTSESGSFLQSWEWGEWQVRLGRTVYRFKIIDDSGTQIGSVQLIKMPLPFGRCYLYAPYGPIFVKNQEPNNKNQINFKDLIFKFPEAIFFRLEPKLGVLDLGSWDLPFQKTANIQPAKTLLVDLSKTEEQLLAGMHSKTRYNIRLAQKHGVRVEKDLAVTPRHGLYFKEVIEQIVETQKRQGYKGHAGGYYKNMIDFFGLKKESGVKINIYKTLFKNQLLSSAVFFDFGQTRTYLFGGSSQENKQIMAPYLMHFQAMLDAKAAGLLQYDFWGIETASGKAPGFARFKLGFGGAVLEYPGAFDYPVRKLQYEIYRFFRKIKKII